MASSPIDEVAQSFSRLMRLSARAKSKVGADQGLNFKSSGILIHLANSGPARSSEIGEALHFDPAVVSRQTHELIDLELIERIPDPLDGRATKLQCTAKGLATYNKNKAFRRAFFEDLLKSWTSEDIETLNHLLNTLTSDFEAKLGTDDHTMCVTKPQEN
jgi:DNA-binding MarR family transcriptional regulator